MAQPVYEVCGAVKSTYDSRDYKITPKDNFHTFFDAYENTKVTVPVKNQGIQPTCVAHAATAAIEFHHRRQQKKTDKFSTEFVYGLREVGYYVGDGMMIRDALKTMQKYGVPFEQDCPGNSPLNQAMKVVSEKENEYKELASPHRISAYIRLNSEKEMKTALMEYGPILVSMTTYKKVDLVGDNKVYTLTEESTKSGRHCVMIYGWNEEGWLTQNSWGRNWGRYGRFVIPYSFKLNEAWGIADDIVSDDIIKPKTNKFIAFCNRAWRFIAGNVVVIGENIGNWFKNLFKKKDNE